MSDVSRVPRYFDTSDGGQVGLHASRWEERHRRSRVVLPARASCWDYAPLIDVVRPGASLNDHRYLGMCAEEWLAKLRRCNLTEYEAARTWYESRVAQIRHKLDCRPRIPNKDYAVELPAPPMSAQLPSALIRTGLKRASVTQWLATIDGFMSNGLRAEELRLSGLQEYLQQLPGSRVCTVEELTSTVDLAHVQPRLVCESTFGFASFSGWRECCEVKSGPLNARARESPDDHRQKSKRTGGDTLQAQDLRLVIDAANSVRGLAGRTSRHLANTR